MSELIGQLIDPWRSPLVARGGLTAVLVGIPAAAIGCWVLLRDLPYAAESLSHGMFPGLVAAALLGLPVALGGLAGLLLAAVAIIGARCLTVETETGVAVAITPLLALGALLALSGPLPPGVGDALFGDVLGTGGADVLLAGCMAAAVVIVLGVAHWRLLAAGLTGRNSVKADSAVLVLLAVATVASARTMGALLTVALIIGPAAAARHLTRRAPAMLATASAIAAAAVIAGIEISWQVDVAAGPAIALCAVAPAALASLYERLQPGPRASRTARLGQR